MRYEFDSVTKAYLEVKETSEKLSNDLKSAAWYTPKLVKPFKIKRNGALYVLRDAEGEFIMASTNGEDLVKFRVDLNSSL